MGVMTAEALHAVRVHHALDEVIALHTVFVSGAIGEMRKRQFAQLVFFQLPEVSQIPAHVEAHRPVVILAFDGILERLPL